MLPPGAPARPGGDRGRRARWRPDLLVLADYGQIVPAALLDLPRHGALNLHPSLLPRHRGASPIPAAILAGDAETGVTLMRMDAGLDTGPDRGPARACRSTATRPRPSWRRAWRGVAARAAASSRCRPGWTASSPPRPQPEEGATLTRPLRREDGRLDPARPARRAGAPGARLPALAGHLPRDRRRARHRLARAAGRRPRAGAAAGDAGARADGDAGARRRATACSSCDEVQPAGGRRMSGADAARGRPAPGRRRSSHAAVRPSALGCAARMRCRCLRAARRRRRPTPSDQPAARRCARSRDRVCRASPAARSRLVRRARPAGLPGAPGGRPRLVRARRSRSTSIRTLPAALRARARRRLPARHARRDRRHARPTAA